MTELVIDASVAIKWVVEEEGTEAALALRNEGRLIAPGLLFPECANILWKKVQRQEFDGKEAVVAAKLLARAEIELVEARSLLPEATRIAVDLNHPAYDCYYLALAAQRDCRFVTADDRLLRALERADSGEFRDRSISLREARSG